ncbi:hypothetical protein ACQKEN_03510 [Pseudomonas sp. NPDC078416]|uniref:hypothetical protein n=1 Tax=Pseudomonas sp. NPDC078416 TaxID=3390637 RepID=UPI003CFD14FA
MEDITFEILQSKKTGLNSPESYVVVREETGFLRILGDDPQWELMTATASEDHGRVKVCANQLRLIESALRLGAELETSPSVERDWAGREYVKICVITQHRNQNDKDFNSELAAAFSRFFEIYESYTDVRYRAREEMVELYNDLSTGDLSDEVYLSDGVWLGSDGSLFDRGR